MTDVNVEMEELPIDDEDMAKQELFAQEIINKIYQQEDYSYARLLIAGQILGFQLYCANPEDKDGIIEQLLDVGEMYQQGIAEEVGVTH